MCLYFWYVVVLFGRGWKIRASLQSRWVFIAVVRGLRKTQHLLANRVSSNAQELDSLLHRSNTTPKNVLLLEMLILQSIYSSFKMDWPFLACAPVLSTTAARSRTSHCHNGAKVSSQGWGWCCWPQSGACKKPLKQGDGGVLENHCISISLWNSSQFLARMNNSLGTINRESPAVLCAEAHGAVCKPPCEDVVLHRRPTCSQPHVPVNSRFCCAFTSFEPAGRFWAHQPCSGSPQPWARRVWGHGLGPTAPAVAEKPWSDPGTGNYAAVAKAVDLVYVLALYTYILCFRI